MALCVSPPHKHDITSHIVFLWSTTDKISIYFGCIFNKQLSMAGSDWISRVPWNHPSEFGYFFFCSSEISISYTMCRPSCLNSGTHLEKLRTLVVQNQIETNPGLSFKLSALKINIDLVIYVTKQNFLIYIWLLLNNNNYKWLITDFKQNWKTTKNYLYQIDWLLQKHINFCTCNCDHMKYSKLTS